ncbi:carboxylic ester hydrolase-like [Hylaeus anthracinus]|uniref:carboxylic ester hydrolase-like n=1 Tax=Hylaeus anthracinus TaxID=313031 RepID=UPI0023BA1944|nr:carboxylic ester hydrolase-like [Hylaeus anthracinus]
MKVLLCLLVGAICITGGYLCEVKTSVGTLSGVQQVSSDGQVYWAFNGIPYAQPPVGILRFKSPVAKVPWLGTLKADKDRSECIQYKNGVMGSEDCLYLNVFTPQVKRDARLPVMVYIHGDTYSLGNASKTTTGAGFLLDKQIVLVTFNYRLGIFGFLSTGDLEAPGNYGLKDQVMALKWVKQNIREFGGNPEDVTIFGESSGGECAHLHTFSQGSSKLFKRAIAQSGVALCPRSFTVDPSYYEMPKKVAAKFNCQTTNSLLMINCLRTIDAEKLVDTNSVWDELSILTQNLWRPTKEPVGLDAFLTDSPWNLIRKNKINDCPLVIGNVKDEGTFFTRWVQQDNKLYDKIVNDPVKFIIHLLRSYEPLREEYYNTTDNTYNITDIAVKIKEKYMGVTLSKDKDTIIYQLTQLTSDYFYTYPTLQLLEKLKSIKKELLFTYIFDYHGKITKSLRYSGELAKTGVAHEDDLFYLFPETSKEIGPQYNIERSENDYKMVDIMIDLWTSFANSSTPVSSHLDDPKIWKPYKQGGHLKIGNISEVKVSLQKGFRRDKMQFWSEHVPRYPLTSCHGDD